MLYLEGFHISVFSKKLYKNLPISIHNKAHIITYSLKKKWTTNGSLCTILKLFTELCLLVPSHSYNFLHKYVQDSNMTHFTIQAIHITLVSINTHK